MVEELSDTFSETGDDHITTLLLEEIKHDIRRSYDGPVSTAELDEQYGDTPVGDGTFSDLLAATDDDVYPTAEDAVAALDEQQHQYVDRYR